MLSLMSCPGRSMNQSRTSFKDPLPLLTNSIPPTYLPLLTLILLFLSNRVINSIYALLKTWSKSLLLKKKQLGSCAKENIVNPCYCFKGPCLASW